jgi:hypothetical protein
MESLDFACGNELHLLVRIRGSRYGDLRFLAEEFGLGTAVFPRYCPTHLFGGCVGFHRYEPVGTHGLLRGDAVIYVLNPARVPL